MMGSTVVFPFDFKKWQKRAHAQRNLEKYIDDPVSFVHSRSMKVIDKVSDYDVVYEYVYGQLTSAREHLEQLRCAIPKLIETNRKSLASIIDDKRSKAELESLYLQLERIIPHFKDELAAFYNTNLRTFDYSISDVEMVSGECKFGKPERNIGLWTEITHGRLKERDNSTAVVSVKTYRGYVSHQHLLCEEKHFR
jgi:hypothetical protein